MSAESFRVRDENRKSHPRKKRPSDNPEAQKERNVKRKTNSRKKSGTIQYYFDSDSEKLDLLNKLDRVKIILGRGKVSGTTNYQALTSMLDFFLEQHNISKPATSHNTSALETVTKDHTLQYQAISKDKALCAKLFLATENSLQNLISRAHKHGQTCNGQLELLESSRLGHALRTIVVCSDKSNEHRLHWTSSPNLPGGKLLVNTLVAHAFFSSGLRETQYQKFCDAANMGVLGEAWLSTAQEKYACIVHDQALEACDNASYEAAAISASMDKTGVDIMTDARYCWRRNARFSDTVCLSAETHKVMWISTLTREDEVCTQKHELMGTQQIYERLDNLQIPVETHCHDNNPSVSKLIRERGEVENTLDTWHATKHISRDVKKICSGARKNEGKTWHPELADKAGSIKTHIYWCMKNCNRDASTLKLYIDNIIPHYQGHHNNCHPTSRCRTDQPYIPTKTPITDPAAIELLSKFLHSLPQYTKPELYTACQNTHYVESFNNALLQYQDKRVAFGYKSYRMRTDLTILDWNENVDRTRTSEKTNLNAAHPRRRAPTHVSHKPKTYKFRQSLLNSWLDYHYD